MRPDEARLREIAWTAGIDGSFQLDPVEQGSVTARPERGGFALSGAGADRWRIEEPEDGSHGFVLVRETGGTREEIARTTREEGTGLLPADLILEDGRLFRWTVRGAREPRFELSGWETPGAYIEVVRSPVGWTLRRTVAGMDLNAPLSLWILLGAEIARAERDDVRDGGGRIDA